jgi:translation initiation factor 4B
MGDRDPTRGDSIREMGNWTRSGPLSDPPPRAGRQPSDFGGERREFGERRPPRDPAAEPKPTREFNWERKGPLSPLPQAEPAARGPPAGLGERSESRRGERRQSPATWGEGRPEGQQERTEGSRPPRREAPPPSAADKDMQWRDRMRPDASVSSPPPENASTPTSPVPSAAAPTPAQRPKLNLAKRTVSEATDAASLSAGSDAKASHFGAARPINTAAREREIEEKRRQAIKEKKEAEEKAKEERRRRGER